MVLLEKVAKAIHDSLEQGLPERTRQQWHELSGPAQDAYYARARAAVEVMKEHLFGHMT
jgi:hypothetical protein